MPRYCKVCGASKETVRDLILFQAPDTPKRRTQWSQACGIPITKSTLICQHHFLPSDILGSEKRMRLKLNALPTAFLYCEPESSIANSNSEKEISKREQNMLQTEIKTEPPEIYLPVTELNIKEEPKDTYEPMILIHEAHFDAHNTHPQTSSIESDAITETQTDNVQKPNLQRKTWGRIDGEVKEDANVLILICNLCDKEFEISKYEAFAEHIREHQDDSKITKNKHPQTTAASEKCDKNLNNECSRDDFDANDEDLKDEFNASEQSEDDSSNNDLKDEEEQSRDEEYQPKAKKIKKDQRRDTKSKEDNLISFSTPNKQCVIDFLDLVKTNAILWHRRQSIMKRFDETMSTVTTIFNTKWPDHQMTEEQSRLSITRIKDLYKRITDTNHKRHTKNSLLQKKYPEYFKLCAEIEENSKKCVNSCDNCLAFFFNEIDLQVHKVKTHRIGELPFKCKFCKYGFSKPEKLAEHELRHERSNAFTCEICNRGFHCEKQFKNHSAIHDYKRICEICGEVFTSQPKYRRHKIHHEAPKEKCEICGKVYFLKWHLSEHIKSHRNERLYECDICGKSFNHQNDVTIHKRGVHNVKPQSRKYIWVTLPATNTEASQENQEVQQLSADDDDSNTVKRKSQTDLESY